MTHPDDLNPGEFVLTDQVETLLRQIHPAFYDNGRISSSAFTPTAKDDGRLSVRRESMLSARDSYRDHFECLGLNSIGVAGFSVGEASEASLRVVDDSALTGSPEAHAYADFRSMSRSQAKDAAKKLRNAASSRGLLYVPPANTDAS